MRLARPTGASGFCWVWDWGRSEAPTELQIRDLERRTGCHNPDLRATLIDVYSQAKKNKVAFADLLYQKIQTLQGEAEPTPRRGDRLWWHHRHRR